MAATSRFSVAHSTSNSDLSRIAANRQTSGSQVADKRLTLSTKEMVHYELTSVQSSKLCWYMQRAQCTSLITVKWNSNLCAAYPRCWGKGNTSIYWSNAWRWVHLQLQRWKDWSWLKNWIIKLKNSNTNFYNNAKCARHEKPESVAPASCSGNEEVLRKGCENTERFQVTVDREYKVGERDWRYQTVHAA